MKNSGRIMFIAGLFAGIIFIIAANWAYNNILFYLPLTREMNVQQKITAIMDILDGHYVDEFEKEQLTEGIYAGLVAELGDPYTLYMDAEKMAVFLQQTEGTYTGIGIVVSIDANDNRIVVIAPYEGSPGETAGIQPGDKIIKVDGVSVSGDMLDLAVSMMKGPPDTAVIVTIYRDGGDSIFDTEVIRAVIDIPTVSYKMMDGSIGYIRISNFDRVTVGQFTKGYEELNKQGMKGLILDLRNNPGGLLDVVVSITDMLVAGEYILYTEDKNGAREYLYADDTCIEVPLVVLVNGGSASASEVLSGAVKDTDTGLLVGTKTYGKGLVQNLFTLPDGSGVKVTVSKYYTPAGICIDREGIVPDYIIEMPDGEDTAITFGSEQDAQLTAAVELITEAIRLR